MEKFTAFVRKTAFFIVRALLYLNFRLELKGEKNIPRISSALIVANHSSYLDVFIIGTALFNNLINLRWVISKNNYRLWFLKWFYWIFRVIPVNGTVEKIKEALNKNKWVVIFPEGAKRWCFRDHGLREKKYTGAAVIALSTGTTLIPIYIKGADKALSPGSFKFNRQYPITAIVGKPFKFERIEEGKIDDALKKKTLEEITRHITELS